MQAYNAEIETLIESLHSNVDLGLSEEEAGLRLKRYGENRLKETAEISPWKIFARQFRNLIVLLLAAAAVISAAMGEYLEAVAVLVVIILNALFGFFTEYRAEKAMEALKSLVEATAKVVRGGRMKEVSAVKLVPGDIIIVEEGDQVAADARLLIAEEMATLEASLTGEAQPVEKKAVRLRKEDIPVADRINMVFMGTTVARGNGRAIVTSTGTGTQIGEVSVLLEAAEEEKTPLEKKLDVLGKQLAFLSLAIAGLIAVIGLLVGNPLAEILKTSIALAVAAVPEGLPAVVTITLAIGLTRMARQRAIIRRLPAVETLGSITTICTDKTGTLTENQMTLEQIWLGGRNVSVTGAGYQPEGEFRFDSESDAARKDLEWFLKAAALSSNAGVSRDDEGIWDVIGDPTEGALVVAAMKGGFDVAEGRLNGYLEEREIPFRSEEKRMAVYYRTPGGRFVIAKGSPEAIVGACSRILVEGEEYPLDERWKREIEDANKATGSRGLRVIGLGYRPVQSSREEAFADLVFLGLAGIMDPPREEVRGAIEDARRAGIRTVMITGDQAATAEAIGDRLGLTYGGTIHGRELPEMTDEELSRALPQTSIIARVSPRDKLRIVRIIKNSGHIVAMTGDGVNDAPALKEADVGVAMGIQGTEVAKEAADLILADDNYATIIRAVKEGRVIFSNITKFLHYLFSCNLSEILFIFVTLVSGLPLPLVALQILWLNLVTDVFPALSLGWEPAEEGIMKEPPRDPGRQIMNGGFRTVVVAHGLILAMGSLLAYVLALRLYGDLTTARTVAFVTVAVIQLAHAFNVRNAGILRLDRTMFSNPYLWGAIVLVLLLQAAAVYVPMLNTVLKTVPLGAEPLILIAAVVLSTMLVLQVFNRIGCWVDGR